MNYVCSVEALDYETNPNAINDLKKMLNVFSDVKIIEDVVQPGDPVTEGAGAGVICIVHENDYKRIDREYREIASEFYKCDPMFYRLGLCISKTTE